MVSLVWASSRIGRWCAPRAGFVNEGFLASVAWQRRRSGFGVYRIKAVAMGCGGLYLFPLLLYSLCVRSLWCPPQHSWGWGNARARLPAVGGQILWAGVFLPSRARACRVVMRPGARLPPACGGIAAEGRLVSTVRSGGTGIYALGRHDALVPPAVDEISKYPRGFLVSPVCLSTHVCGQF